MKTSGKLQLKNPNFKCERVSSAVIVNGLAVIMKVCYCACPYRCNCISLFFIASRDSTQRHCDARKERREHVCKNIPLLFRNYNKYQSLKPINSGINVLITYQLFPSVKLLQDILSTEVADHDFSHFPIILKWSTYIG